MWPDLGASLLHRKCWNDFTHSHLQYQEKLQGGDNSQIMTQSKSNGLYFDREQGKTDHLEKL